MCEKDKPDSASESLPTDQLPEQKSEAARARQWKSPPPKPPEHEIHERPYIPPVPEGEQVPDERPSPPIEWE
jgi:hypothetical protein